MRQDLKKNIAQIAAIGAVALLSRQIYLDQMGQDPLFEIVVGPTGSAVDFARGNSPQTADLMDPPTLMYAVFLRAVYDLFGQDLAHVRDVQSVIGTLSCLLLWSLARTRVSHRVALATGLMAAIYGPFIYFDGALRPTALAIFLSLLALRVMVSALNKGGRASALWPAGLLLGLAALCGAHLLLFAVLAAWWLWRHLSQGTGAVSLLLGFAVVALVWTWQFSWPWTPQDMSVTAAGIYDFWRGHEVLVDDPYYASGYSPLLSALLWVRGLSFPFGLVGPLALVAIGSRLRDRDRPLAETSLLLFLGAGAISGMLFEADAAGRATIVPVLLLSAAAGVSRWLAASRQARRLSLGAFILLCLALNVYQGVLPVVTEQHHWRGEAYAQRGMNVNAQREYEAAVRHQGGRVDSYLSLAAIYIDGDDFDRAVAVYRKLLLRWPDHAEAGKSLAAAYMGSERFAEATAAYEEMSVVDPDFALPRLAQARLSADDRLGAIRTFEELLIRQPENSQVRYLLALLYSEQGQRADAAEAYRLLLDDPKWGEKAGLRLARLLVEAGRQAEAESLLRSILTQINPDSEMALAQLGRLHHERGQYEEALVYLERLRPLQTEVHQTYFYLSEIYRKLGRNPEAEETMQLYERYRLQEHRADLEQRVEKESSLMFRQFMEMMP